MLNKDQLSVVNASLESNIAIIACAGSGKTTTILNRIKKMIEFHKVKPSEIVLTTFTVEAAKDIKSRLGNKFRGVQIGTIDGISRGVLQKYAYDWISKYKIMSISEYGPLFLKFLTIHERRGEYLDQIKYLIIDEYQDIDKTQYEIIRRYHSTNHVRITAIGDDSQNIYSFRGSDVKYILQFNKDFTPSLNFMLKTNYRCGSTITDVANESINLNKKQIKKEMIPNIKIDKKPKIHSFQYISEQSKFIVNLISTYHKNKSIPLSQIVVLCRMTKPLYTIECLLERKNINNRLLDGTVRKNHGNLNDEAVTLCTIHKSKGLEWKVVIILECNDKIFPMSPFDSSSNNIEEERRLFYVAVTRAKEYIHLTFTNTYEPSRFITEIDRNLFDFDTASLSQLKLSNKQNYDDTIYREYRKSLSVTSIVRTLNGGDYLSLREKNILMNFIFDTKQLSTPIKTPKWVYNKRLEKNFGLFIDTYMYREMMCILKKPIQCVKAKQIIASLELVPEHYDQYIRHIESIRYSSDEMIALLSNSKNNIVINLIKRILGKAKQYSLPHQCIPVILKDSIPFQHKNKLSKSIDRYLDPKISSKSILSDIFWISQSSEILAMRKRILYVPIDFDSLNRIQFSLDESIQSYIDHNIKRNEKTVVHQYLVSHNGICGEFDVVHHDNLIDWKASKISDITLEWVVQLLLYVYLCRDNNIDINSIAIYNPLSGKIMSTKIDWWKRDKALANYVINKMKEV